MRFTKQTALQKGIAIGGRTKKKTHIFDDRFPHQFQISFHELKISVRVYASEIKDEIMEFLWKCWKCKGLKMKKEEVTKTTGLKRMKVTSSTAKKRLGFGN